MAQKSHSFPIAGIGASAGGIAALEGFFKGMPDMPGMAFVIVTHLSPEREASCTRSSAVIRRWLWWSRRMEPL